MAEHIMKDAELASMLKGQISSAAKEYDTLTDAEELHLAEEDIKWWRDAKIGMFIHWGIYSVVGKGEWSYFNEKMDETEYRKIGETQFKQEKTADEITDEWMQYAKMFGANYAVMVTRHHDGYALWDSACSWKDFTTVKLGPGRDYVDAFTRSCRKYGMKVGLYYSPMDWRFPGYFEYEKYPESAKLMKEQAYGQIKELATKYGPVDIFWYDGGWLAHRGTDADAAWFWEPVKMNKMLRSYQPKVMVTPRSGYRGDFLCDEGPKAVYGKVIHTPWEKCLSASAAWGYIPNDRYYSFEFLLTMMINTVCRGGNYLLNVGPKPNGEIPEEEKVLLKQLGEWLRENGESVYGTRGGFLEPVDDVYGCTQTKDALYFHILDCESFQNQRIDFGKYVPENACILNGEEIPFELDGTTVKFLLPEDVVREKKVDTIIKVHGRMTNNL
ncbi:MAG: alpha-L-fucosidase [Acetatifactor sp.]|nr:alpha-L-fucosidase [Acetatifactor sp.]